MKHKILIAAMAIAALLLPMEINAKGKPASVTLLKDANGVTIGRVIGMEHVSKPYVLTDQGYRTMIPIPVGRVVEQTAVYYGSEDCSDPAFIGHTRHVGTVFIPTSNSELAYASGAILYSPGDAQLVTIDINRTLDENFECVPFLFPNAEVYPAYENDPAVTGIENTVYPTRMIIE